MGPARAELLTVVVERRGRDVIVRAAGELDLSTAPQLYDALRRAGEDANARLILELGQLAFIDASGLSAIARVSHEFGERFTLASPPRFVRRVLAIAG